MATTKKTVKTAKSETKKSAKTTTKKTGKTVVGVPVANKSQASGEQKSRLVAALLAIFLGSLGIHNFYLGKNNLGLAQLLIATIGGVLTCGIATGAIQIWAFIEGIFILTKTAGYNTDADGQALRD